MNATGLDVYVVTAVLSTLTTIFMIGLGFLYSPTSATLLWSLSFLTSTLGVFVAIVAVTAGLDWLDAAASALQVAVPILVWAGVRALRTRRTHAWIAVVLPVATMIGLGTTPGVDLHAVVFSVAFFASTVFAALTVHELLRRPERGGGMLLPLTLVSFVLPVLGLSVVIAAPLAIGLSHQVVLPDLRAVGHIVYLCCAVVTLLYLARFADLVVSDGGTTPFSRVVADRLDRARTAEERSWSLLALSLDDLATLRVAGGDQGLDKAVARLRADARRVFPVEADIGPDPRTPTTVLVLISRPDAEVRRTIRDLLDRVSELTEEQPIAIELSASIGWACVRDSGFDAETLIQDARAAMLSARATGGGSWERHP